MKRAIGGPQLHYIHAKGFYELSFLTLVTADCILELSINLNYGHKSNYNQFFSSFFRRVTIILLKLKAVKRLKVKVKTLSLGKNGKGKKI